MRRPDLLFLVVIWLFFSAFLYFIAIAAIAAPARLARATPTSAGDDRLPRVLTGRLRPPDSYAGGGYGTNIRSGPTNGVRSHSLTVPVERTIEIWALVARLQNTLQPSELLTRRASRV